ncbi:MAG TPA: helix-turn-helix domain-containing protein [Candidatus Nanoarchaeia archaeon]|nr:helix-turn-helix domain-containing protein [Candidatus Nanoarchaeia archaeon]
MEFEILEDLGLTNAEIKVYVQLLELGISSAKNIIYKSKLQNSVVHRALNSLIEKGLIHYILKGKHKVYTATEPEYFFTYMEDKKKQFEAVFPKLKQKQLSQKKETQTSMFKGKKGISEVYYKLISQSKGEFLTFGGSKETTGFMGLTWWKNMYLNRIKNKLHQRHIASTEVLPYIYPFLKMKLTKMRFIPKEQFSQYQETAIIDDYVAITIFADEGYCILIHNKDAADGYRKNFEMMWNLAREKKEPT